MILIFEAYWILFSSRYVTEQVWSRLWCFKFVWIISWKLTFKSFSRSFMIIIWIVSSGLTDRESKFFRDRWSREMRGQDQKKIKRKKELRMKSERQIDSFCNFLRYSIISLRFLRTSMAPALCPTVEAGSALM